MENITVEKETVVKDNDLQNILWKIYNSEMTKLNEECPCLQSYNEVEFKEVLEDADILKFIAKVGDDIAGLGLLTNNLHKVKWISTDFYRIHYPNEFRGNNIWYVKAFVVAQNFRGKKIGIKLLDQMIHHMPEGSIGAFDFSEKMNPHMVDFVKACWPNEAIGEGMIDRQIYVVFKKGTDTHHY